METVRRVALLNLIETIHVARPTGAGRPATAVARPRPAGTVRATVSGLDEASPADHDTTTGRDVTARALPAVAKGRPGTLASLHGHVTA